MTQQVKEFIKQMKWTGDITEEITIREFWVMGDYGQKFEATLEGLKEALDLYNDFLQDGSPSIVLFEGSYLKKISLVNGEIDWYGALQIIDQSLYSFSDKMPTEELQSIINTCCNGVNSDTKMFVL